VVKSRSWSSSAPRSQRLAAVRLLVECVRARDTLDGRRAEELLAETSPATVLEAAAYHAVDGLAYRHLRDLAGAPAQLIEALRQRHDAAVRHHLGIMFELARLGPVLDESGARWAVVKGPIVAELLYEAPGQRSYGDLDVIVEPAGFDRAIASLEAHGSRVLDRNWEVMRRDLLGELHIELPGGSLLDLHWNLVNMYRGRIRVDTSAMLDRAEVVDLGGVRAPTLDPTDSLIHLALHGTLSGGDRLLWMSDIARATWRRPPGWGELVRRARDWRVGAPVGFMLARSRVVAGADVPGDVPRRLLGRRYGALMRFVDRVSPWEGAGGRLTAPGLVLSRSMGFGLAGAARWFVVRAIRNLDPREPEASSTFTPRGDRGDYEAFIRAVVGSSTRSTKG
jgi:hypothetical protein